MHRHRLGVVERARDQRLDGVDVLEIFQVAQIAREAAQRVAKILDILAGRCDGTQNVPGDLLDALAPFVGFFDMARITEEQIEDFFTNLALKLNICVEH